MTQRNNNFEHDSRPNQRRKSNEGFVILCVYELDATGKMLRPDPVPFVPQMTTHVKYKCYSAVLQPVKEGICAYRNRLAEDTCILVVHNTRTCEPLEKLSVTTA